MLSVTDLRTYRSSLRSGTELSLAFLPKRSVNHGHGSVRRVVEVGSSGSGVGVCHGALSAAAVLILIHFQQASGFLRLALGSSLSSRASWRVLSFRSAVPRRSSLRPESQTHGTITQEGCKIRIGYTDLPWGIPYPPVSGVRVGDFSTTFS